jgi:hypothetical protein
MGWKQDRILVFISAAQFINDRADRKYYFDKDDKVFFNLYVENNEYKIFYTTPANLTKEREENLRSKIRKVRTNSPSIVEVQKMSLELPYSPGTTAKNEEEFKLRWEMERQIAQFAFDFLKDNNIDLETADVIELYEQT